MEPPITNSEVKEPQINDDGFSNSVSAQESEELHRFECRSCGYIYEPAAGDPKRRISGNTAFEQLPSDWRCPVCSARTSSFIDIGVANKPSGFTENLGYGLGVNTLTPAQKNLLIFGSLALAFAFFMSLYALD